MPKWLKFGLIGLGTMALTMIAMGGILLFARTTSMGRPADYNVALQGIDGTQASLEDFRGQVIFFNYWATWCGPCRDEMPSIQKLYNSQKDSGVVFVLASNEDPATVKRFIDGSGFTFPVYVLRSDLPGCYSTPGIPATWIISKDGRIKEKHIGGRDWNAPTVRDLLDGLNAL